MTREETSVVLREKTSVVFDRARAVADAVLFEGYALYPYRASAIKNQLRWQFGVLMPRSGGEPVGCDPWHLEVVALVAAPAGTRLDGLVRFLRVRRRRIEAATGESLAQVEVGGRLLVPWDEGELCEHPFALTLGEEPRESTIALEGDRVDEAVPDAPGGVIARVVHERAPLALRLVTASEAWERGFTLRVRLDNLSASAATGSRDQRLLSAAIGAHVMLAVADGAFLSLTDPPAWAEVEAAACRSTGVHPVLAGAPGQRDLLLASPIILPDHPQVAPESPGDLFDATEIDEILTLRTMTLTDDEKRQARATDDRVAALIDRVDRLSTNAMGRLHGAFREVAAADRAVAPFAPGDKVRLRPGPRRTDAQDMFLADRIATVRRVEEDVDGRACLAVTVDDDPAADLLLAHGRYHYFYLDEVEPVVTNGAEPLVPAHVTD